MAQEICDVLFYFAVMVGAGACGGLIVLLFDHRLTIARDRNTKREQFRSNIELLTRKLEGTLIRDLAFDAAGDFRYIKQFETFISDVRPHIPNRSIGKFDDAFIAYKTIRFGAIGDLEKNAEAEKTKAKLVSILGEISELSR